MSTAAYGHWPRELLLSGCAVLLALYALRQAAAPTSHHVRVRPSQSRMTTTWGTPTTKRNTRPLEAPHNKGSRPTTAARAANELANLPVLSITAIVLSVVAIVASVFRGSPAASVPAERGMLALPAPPLNLQEDEDEPMPFPVASQSFNMDEIAQALKEDQARRKNFTPKQCILDLQRGNARFWSGIPNRPEINAMERRALIIAQAPTVAILSCADSRVPVEILFDQGLGSLFVVRVAGNILDPVAMGSLEFSVKYLGVKAILVMGHEACGAVKGAMTMSSADIMKQPKYLREVLTDIKANLDVSQLNRIQDHRAQDREAVVVNTTAQVKRLQENTLIKERVSNGSLMVCGAFYEITSGIVDFFTLDKNGLVTDV